MDIVSDVRYSVLKEKSSSSTPNSNHRFFKANIFENEMNSIELSTAKNNSLLANNTNHHITKEISLKTNEDLISIASNLNNSTSNINNASINMVTTTSSLIVNGAANLDQTNVINIPELEFNNFIAYKNKRTLTEKILFLLNILLLLILLIFIFSSLSKQNSEKIKEKYKFKGNGNFCDTDACILVAGSIYKSLNKKVDPCEDFYEYSCGGWMSHNLIPNGFPRWGTLSLVTYQNQLIIKEQLESNTTVPEITEAELKAKIFYRSCMDKYEIIENLGSKPLKEILDKYVYKDKDNKLVVNESFENLISILQIEYGLNSLFEFNVLDDDKNPNVSNIEIIQGSLSLDRSFYINNSTEKNTKVVDVYKKVIVNILSLLFGKLNNVTQEMENLFQFETDLAKIMYPSEKLSNVESMYTRVKLVSLTKQYGSFLNWTKFINRFLKRYDSDQVLNENDEIIVMGLEYFTSLTNLIKEYQKDPAKEKTLRFSVLFHLIKFSLPLLSKDYRNQLTTIGEALTGTVNVERWQTCIEHTDSIFGLGYAITKMFVRKSANDAKHSAKRMIKSIKKSFVENFPKIPWMDEETRRLAEEKVNSVDELIGYPDFIDNDDLLNNRYKELYIAETDYYGNEIRLVQYALKSEIVTYRTQVNRAEWEMTSSAVNAYYSPTRNQIVFPSGILQEPFFHPMSPMSINYGSIGSVMGHELTHGFDDSGREYDKYGMLHQWWNNKTIEDFEHASECIVNQYSEYTIGDENLNGRQTLGENIADNGGLRSAYEAYETWVKENGEEKQLPLLNLSHRQLFFVSFAQTWCTKSTEDSVHLSLSVDQHSPPRFRVIGSISNSVEFANAFQCPKDSKMNPSKKCQLW